VRVRGDCAAVLVAKADLAESRREDRRVVRVHPNLGGRRCYLAAA
jgi:hypothetical protein